MKKIVFACLLTAFVMALPFSGSYAEVFIKKNTDDANASPGPVYIPGQDSEENSGVYEGNTQRVPENMPAYQTPVDPQAPVCSSADQQELIAFKKRQIDWAKNDGEKRVTEEKTNFLRTPSNITKIIGLYTRCPQFALKLDQENPPPKPKL